MLNTLDLQRFVESEVSSLKLSNVLMEVNHVYFERTISQSFKYSMHIHNILKYGTRIK